MEVAIGIDPGVRAMGVVALESSSGRFLGAKLSECDGEWSHCVGRHLQSILSFVEELEQEYGKLRFSFALEGYAYGSRFKRRGVDRSIETAGVVKYELLKKGMVFVYPPNSVKKSFTGRGNASKAEMLIEAQRRGFRRANQHIVDAYAVALHHLQIQKQRGKH